MSTPYTQLGVFRFCIDDQWHAMQEAEKVGDIYLLLSFSVSTRSPLLSLIVTRPRFS
jgi:hypothetical protein